jgi:hypothetical protein
MNKVTKILIGILIWVIGLNVGMFVLNFKQEIKVNNVVLQTMITTKFGLLQNEINILNIDRKINDYTTNQKIINLPRNMQITKEKLEQKLKQVNVEIVNSTVGASGSGVTIKYNGQYYILSAGHMADEDTDTLVLMENGQEISELEIVKHDYTWGEDTDPKDIIKVHDLILLRPKNKNLQPKYYTELADIEPITSSEVYIVGNPMGIEDVLCEGRTIIYKGNFMYYIDHTYYGNSGGGVYTLDGKLVGIVSHLMPIQPYQDIPAYMIYGAVRLNCIRDFLKDVK